MSSNKSIQKLTVDMMGNHPQLLLMIQKCRYILMRGPLQNSIVRYYQKRSAKKDQISYALPEPGLFPQMNIERIVRELNEKGYSVGFHLPAEFVAQIMEFRDSMRSNDLHHPHKTCDVFNKVVCDPNVIAVARGYLGVEPILYGTRIYASKNYIPDPEKMQRKKMVHFDVADYKDLNLFIYLTDVDEETSPHVVIEGTHKHKTFRDLIAQRYTQSEARKKFGEDKFKTLTGIKGFAFFEDSSAFHIQTRGKFGRVMATANYTLQRRPELARY